MLVHRFIVISVGTSTVKIIRFLNVSNFGALQNMVFQNYTCGAACPLCFLFSERHKVLGTASIYVSVILYIGKELLGTYL